MTQQQQPWRGKFKRPAYRPGDFVQVTDRQTGIARFVQWMPEREARG